MPGPSRLSQTEQQRLLHRLAPLLLEIDHGRVGLLKQTFLAPRARNGHGAKQLQRSALDNRQPQRMKVAFDQQARLSIFVAQPTQARHGGQCHPTGLQPHRLYLLFVLTDKVAEADGYNNFLPAGAPRAALVRQHGLVQVKGDILSEAPAQQGFGLLETLRQLVELKQHHARHQVGNNQDAAALSVAHLAQHLFQGRPHNVRLSNVVSERIGQHGAGRQGPGGPGFDAPAALSNGGHIVGGHFAHQRQLGRSVQPVPEASEQFRSRVHSAVTPSQ